MASISDSPPHTPEPSTNKPPQDFLNTPVADRVHGHYLYGFNERDAQAMNQRHAAEAMKYFLGPMPVQVFMETFLPITSMEGMPSSVGAFSDIPAGAKERDIYKPLVRL